jgi:hypothetical protein
LDADKKDKKARQAIQILLAGRHAEARFRRRAPKHGFEPNFASAAEWGRLVSRDRAEAVALVGWLSERCRNDVAKVWPQIEHVARSLAARGELTGVEVRALMRETLRPPEPRGDLTTAPVETGLPTLDPAGAVDHDPTRVGGEPTRGDADKGPPAPPVRLWYRLRGRRFLLKSIWLVPFFRGSVEQCLLWARFTPWGTTLWQRSSP